MDKQTNIQIPQLQAQFDRLNVGQKREFIDNLKTKTQEDPSPELQNFLHQCVLTYNNELHNTRPTM
jgi:hypothetical protein